MNSENIKPNESNLSQTALGIAGGAGSGLALRKGAAHLLKPYYKSFL